MASVRGVWWTNSGTDAYDSLENIQKTVKLIAASNLNTIYADVWNKGFTQYPSKIMENLVGVPIQPKYAGRDPFGELVRESKKYNLSVYAWFEYGFAASYEGIPSAGILEQYPQWAAIDNKVTD